MTFDEDEAYTLIDCWNRFPTPAVAVCQWWLRSAERVHGRLRDGLLAKTQLATAIDAAEKHLARELRRMEYAADEAGPG
jgi:hypothetical protein